jgi:hypothetical protein
VNEGVGGLVALGLDGMVAVCLDGTDVVV